MLGAALAAGGPTADIQGWAWAGNTDWRVVTLIGFILFSFSIIWTFYSVFRRAESAEEQRPDFRVSFGSDFYGAWLQVHNSGADGLFRAQVTVERYDEQVILLRQNPVYSEWKGQNGAEVQIYSGHDATVNLASFGNMPDTSLWEVTLCPWARPQYERVRVAQWIPGTDPPLPNPGAVVRAVISSSPRAKNGMVTKIISLRPLTYAEEWVAAKQTRRSVLRKAMFWKRAA